jgi:hypothetical protein
MTQDPTAVTSTVRSNQPARQAIATFDNYADAERTVEYLVGRQFAVNRLAIVGRDLQLVERVTGKMNYGVAALRGATSGGLVGALIGWVFGIFSWIQPLIAGLVLAFYGLLFGAALGALVGLLLYALRRGRRDFATVTALEPRFFDVVADVEVAQRALQLLQDSNRRESSKTTSPPNAPSS